MSNGASDPFVDIFGKAIGRPGSAGVSERARPVPVEMAMTAEAAQPSGKSGKDFVMKNVLSFLFALLLLSSVTASAAVKLKFAHGEPEKQSYGVFATMFAENLKSVSKGQMLCTVFPNGVVGSEVEAGQKVKQGTLQMAIVTAANAGSFSPAVNVLTFPYLFSGPEDIMGEKGYLRPGSPLRERLAQRVLDDTGTMRLLAVGTNGFRLLFTKKPVTRMSDLKGVKLRLAASPVMQRTWETWGASAYAMAWSETFTAIQQGVMDAFECPTNILLYNGFYPYTPHVAENLYYCPQIFLIFVNEKWYRKLTPEQRSFLEEAAAKNEREHFAWVQAEYDEVKRQLLGHGVQFHDITDVERWKEKAVALWPEFAGLSGGKAWVDGVMRFRESGSFE